jgi:hypothetical protein
LLVGAVAKAVAKRKGVNFRKTIRRHSDNLLAAEMGITSETLSRTLAKLLWVSGETIVITQPRKVDSLLGKHLGEI